MIKLNLLNYFKLYFILILDNYLNSKTEKGLILLGFDLI